MSPKSISTKVSPPTNIEPQFRMTFKGLLEEYQKTFILYKELQDRLTKRPLYLQRCLRYMEHFRAYLASFKPAKPMDRFVDYQAQRTFSTLPNNNIKLKFHHIDQVEGKDLRSVELELFVVRANIDANNDLYKAFVGKVFMDLTDFRNNLFSELVIDCEKLRCANEDYALWDYSLALVVRYFDKENTDNDEPKEEFFITEILFNDIDQQEDYFYGEHLIMLNTGDIEKCEQKKMINYAKYIWISIEENDVLCESTPSNQSSPKIKFAIQPEPSRKLTYKFVGLQNTLSCDVKCPFCLVDCNCFSALSVHLEACHSRFVYHFNKTRHEITVSLNSKFDDSLEILPRRSNSRRKWPIGVSLLVSSKKRALALQSDFRGCDLANLNYKKERIFYNKNKQPMQPGDEYCDKAYENKLILGRQQIHAQHLNDITDVNNAEKGVMKMFNKFLSYSSAIPSPKSFPQLAIQFVRQNGKQIIKRKLKLNFINYLSLLVQMQLIDKNHMSNIIAILNNC